MHAAIDVPLVGVKVRHVWIHPTGEKARALDYGGAIEALLKRLRQPD